jgi:hypothetical protein
MGNMMAAERLRHGSLPEASCHLKQNSGGTHGVFLFVELVLLVRNPLAIMGLRMFDEGIVAVLDLLDLSSVIVVGAAGCRTHLLSI